VKATSVADTSKSASATVTVTAVAVTISPISASLLTGGTQQFTATVTGSSNTAVTWSTTGGTISSSGLSVSPWRAACTLAAFGQAVSELVRQAAERSLVTMALDRLRESAYTNDPPPFLFSKSQFFIAGLRRMLSGEPQRKISPALGKKILDGGYSSLSDEEEWALMLGDSVDILE
jgi:hypothetical protein